jgi:hypothetical protein
MARPITSTKRLQIEARVEAIAADARWQLFDSGEARLDEVRLTVLSPPELAGRGLRLSHPHPVPADGLWAPGRRLRFVLDPNLLTDDIQLFTGAAQDVEVVP